MRKIHDKNIKKIKGGTNEDGINTFINEQKGKISKEVKCKE